MADWQRLGKYVLARRVGLGFKTRSDFAAAVQLTPRTLSDIENGRRGNFDAVTIAALEKTLGWETGSVQLVVDGGEPLLSGAKPAEARVSGFSATGTVTGRKQSEADEIDLIYESKSMTDEQKLKAIRQVLLLRARVEQQTAAEARARQTRDKDEEAATPSAGS